MRRVSLQQLHVLASLLPFALWLPFHLWEQWSAFQNRDAYLDVMRATSFRLPGRMAEFAFGVVPVLAWFVLEVICWLRAFRADPRAPLAARVLAIRKVAQPASVVALAFLVLHVAHLWVPKLRAFHSVFNTYALLNASLGGWVGIVVYAVGITSLAWHLHAQIPHCVQCWGWLPEGKALRWTRRGASVVALATWVITAQLAGLFVAGVGTFWG